MQRLFKHFDSEYLRCNFDTGNTFIAGHDPLEYLKALRKYIVALPHQGRQPGAGGGGARRGDGHRQLEVPVGRRRERREHPPVPRLPEPNRWDGAVSIECNGTDENTREERRLDEGRREGTRAGKAKGRKR